MELYGAKIACSKRPFGYKFVDYLCPTNINSMPINITKIIHSKIRNLSTTNLNKMIVS